MFPVARKSTSREVELDVEVVVAERVVLRRIEHLEQRRRRVAAPVGADLVDLVQHDHRVHRPGVAKRADEASRKRADVGAAVPADLGLVSDAAERHADELAPGRARDRLADRGLARARRPDQREDRAGALVLLDPALLAELGDGDVLDDPVLHVVQAGVVLVEHLARVDGVEPLLRALAPRHREQPVEVVADHRRLGRLVAHPLEPAELALGLLEDLLGHVRLGQLLPVLLHDGALVLAELLADRLHLPSQDVLALLLLDAGLDVVLDPLPDLHQRQALALELERQLEPLANVHGLEQRDLLLEGDVGGVAGRVRQRAGLGDRADEGGDTPVVAAQLEDLLDDGAVLALELADAAVGGLVVGALLDLDEQAARAVGTGSTGDAAVEALERDRATAAGQPDAIGDLRDRADLRVLVLVLGNEQDAVLVADVDGQGDVHVGEDDDVFQGDEQQAGLLQGCSTRTRFLSLVVSPKSVATSVGVAGGPRSARKPPETAQRGGRDPAGEPVGREAGAARPPRHDARDEDAAAPEDEAGVVARARDPARLVEHRDPPAAAEGRVQLGRVADVREEPEEVPPVGGREARLPRRGAARGRPTRARSRARARPCRTRSCTCRSRTPAARRRGRESRRRASGIGDLVARRT